MAVDHPLASTSSCCARCRVMPEPTALITDDTKDSRTCAIGAVECGRVMTCQAVVRLFFWA
ncbi:hypothetical protein EGA31_04555 [Mycobacterium avium subsp. paratuberculosis]|nr:hypothetical protein EGA31_04555 [Mycobacterium avium subsp. paratuberculosis]